MQDPLLSKLFKIDQKTIYGYTMMLLLHCLINLKNSFYVYFQEKLDAYGSKLEEAFKNSPSEAPIVMGEMYIAYDDVLYHRVRALSQEGQKVRFADMVTVYKLVRKTVLVLQMSNTN